jgi:signal transduction histidine kinase
MIEYEQSASASVSDVAWPSWLADRIAEPLRVLADTAEPNTSALDEAVRALAAIPGVTNAYLRPAAGADRLPGSVRVTAGPAHLVELTGPAALRPDVVQGAGLVAAAMSARLSRVPEPPEDLSQRRQAAPDEVDRTLGRNSPFVIALHEDDGTLRWLSRIPGELSGPRSAVGDLLAGLASQIHPDDRGVLTEIRDRLVAESGDLAETNIRVLGANGEWRTGHIVVRGLVSHGTDVTALHQAHHRLRVESSRLRTLIDSIQVAILMIDENLCVTEVNLRALQLMRVSEPRSALIGLSLLELADGVESSSPEVVRLTLDFANRSLAGGVPVHGEVVHLPDGSVLEADYLPIDLDGEVRGHLLVGRDVTGLAAARHTLEVRNRELGDLATLKTEFLATVSHELRTPLTSASSLLELLGDGDPPNPIPDEIVYALRRNNERLLAIVEDLLLLARIEANQLPLDIQPVETRTLLGDLFEPPHDDAIGHGLSISKAPNESEQTVELLGDPRWLERMIKYAVSGSFASSHPGTLTLHGEVQNGYWTLTVSGDTLHTTGSGSGDVPQSESSEGIGIGIGITLARAIAKRHGGELRIEHGTALSRIQISLPVR